VKQDQKISALRQLLERVQTRAAAPRVAPSPAIAAPEPVVDSPALPAVAAPPSVMATPPAPASIPSARAGSSTLPLDFGTHGHATIPPPSEPPIDREEEPAAAPSSGADRDAIDEADEGPPSAPRLREVPDEEPPVDEDRDVDEEPQIKTPPPESGRQHVTPGPAATIREADDDISITVTMEESEAPPPISLSSSEGASASRAGSLDMPEVTGPQPRLALVSEPEIELHGMTPLSSVAESLAALKAPPPPSVPSGLPSPAPPAEVTALRPQDVELAVPVSSPAPSVPPSTPSGVRSVSTPVPGELSVRLMAEPLAAAPSAPRAPVEIWASTHAPPAIEGHVASFVGQNANFQPKSFGELVRASVALGDDPS
jgi:hypothetical protein